MTRNRLEAFSDIVVAILTTIWLTPFVTAWVAQRHAAPLPVAAYGRVLRLSAVAYFLFSIVGSRAVAYHRACWSRQ